MANKVVTAIANKAVEAGLSKLAGMYEQTDTHVDVVFELDGKDYEVEQFYIEFNQQIDFRGQPQDETRGGILTVSMTQSVDNNIYNWGKRSNLRKNGFVRFKSPTAGTILEVAFENAHCVSLTRSVSSVAGSKATLVIAPARVTMGGVKHDNRWRDELCMK